MIARLYKTFLVALLLLIQIPISASANSPTMTVMSRNIYLGADVGTAMKLLPDFPAAAQFMWDQVKHNDFRKRAPKLAAELASAKPDLVGIQEATVWYCKKDLWSSRVTVFDYLQLLTDATKSTGVGYSVAKARGVEAFNPGYSISAIPYLTKVTDPELFPSIFKEKTAYCGFTIGDAILVRDDRASDIRQVGNTEYEASYSIVPTLMTIYRGYTWVDIKESDGVVRVVSTHLESIFDKDKTPNSVLQAQQLVTDLKSVRMPLVVLGDFNADYRDPRASSAPNPGEQPVVGKACPTPGERSCNAYWIMLDSGFTNLSPDAEDPKNFSWGATDLLNGPDPKRDTVARTFGNENGFTDRLDYVFGRNGVTTQSSRIIGNTWPSGESIWDCGTQRCFATDHAGVVATFSIPTSAMQVDPPLPTHTRFPLGLWNSLGLIILGFIGWRTIRWWRS